MNEGFNVNIYTFLNQKMDHTLLYEYLLKWGKSNQVFSVNVFKAIGGFEKKGHIKEEHFIELGADMPILISFILDKSQKDQLISFLKKEKIALFYTVSTVSCGFLED